MAMTTTPTDELDKDTPIFNQIDIIYIWLQSNKHTIVIVAFWIITLSGAAYAAWSALQSTDQVVKIVVAIIGAAALLIGSILTHAFTALREQRLAQLRQKQENYAQLINKIATFIRDPDVNRDSIETIHLYSWLVGSPSVIAFTQMFMREQKDKTLENLLLMMRQDLELPRTPKNVTIVGKDLFSLQKPKIPGHLKG